MAPCSAAPQTFAGITIVRLNDEAAENAIRGNQGRGTDRGPQDTGEFLVMYVAPGGTYAALAGRGGRGCVSWATPESATSGHLSFGLLASAATMRGNPKVCQPFTVSWEAPDKVRVTTANKFSKSRSGPLSADAHMLKFDMGCPVVVRLPLRAVDWDSPVFAQHDIRGVRLGPLPDVRAALSGKAEITVGPVRRSPLGIRRDFQAAVRESGRKSSVLGFVSPEELHGWPFDTLFNAWLAVRENPASTVQAFDAAILDRYGPETVHVKVSGTRTRWHVWLYDLDAHKLADNGAAPDNCLATREYWLDRAGQPILVPNNQDIGPWGCALMMVLSDNGRGGTVSSYRTETSSGYAAALNHFSLRLAEMRDLREKIGALEKAKPKF